MNTFFNLTTEKWISAIPASGSVDQKVDLSLREVFEQATQLQELHDDIPIVLPPLLRLLLAILHRAWQNQTRSERYEEWWQWWNQERFPDHVFDYLDEQKEKFYLFHPTQPFYQTAGLEVGKEDKPPKSILCLLLNQDNNPTLFDHNMESRPPDFSCAEAARALLVGQSYLAGGTGGQDVKINGVFYKKPSNFFQGPLFSSAVVWLNGETLFETLMLNLSPERAGLDGTPVWEKSIEQQTEEANDAQPCVTNGVTDRLTFQNRLLHLIPEHDEKIGSVVVRRVLMAQGRRPGETRDEMKAYREDQTRGRMALRFNEKKSVWRDAQIIFSSEQMKLGPAAFAHAARVATEQKTSSSGLRIGSRFKVSVVGLANDQAKALLWRHERMPAPVSLLDDSNAATRIAQATEEAEYIADQLFKRFKNVAELFDAPNMDRAGAKEPNPKSVANLIAAFDPRRTFWARLETHFHDYLRRLPEDHEDALSDWRYRLEREAKSCFIASRRALGTSPRALRTSAISDVFRTKARRAERQSEQAELSAAAKTNTQTKEVI